MSATSLAHLWQSQDKRWEAHDLLALVYGWFTEGFDTADLKEAKALLEELADEQWSRIWHTFRRSTIGTVCDCRASSACFVVE